MNAGCTHPVPYTEMGWQPGSIALIRLIKRLSGLGWPPARYGGRQRIRAAAWKVAGAFFIAGSSVL
jgi:hypothetical protein